MSNAGRCHYLIIMRGDVTQGKGKLGNVVRGATIAPCKTQQNTLENYFMNNLTISVDFSIISMLSLRLSQRERVGSCHTRKYYYILS
jgi:hypothetical protein